MSLHRLDVDEWRVTGDPGHGYPPYEFTFRSNDPRWEDAEAKARGFVEMTSVAGGWDDGPHLRHRTVTYSAWELA